MPIPADTALDNTDEHSTTALYRAAVGEVNSAYYLPLFARFEAADRAGLSWNGAAALYTLNWLAFRHLWHAALVYAGVLVGMALGIFGIGRLVFQFSDTTQWGLAGGLVLLSVLLPGLGGNAVLHAATRKRMEAALKATHTVAEACALLSRKAPTRKSLIAQMVANALGLALLAYAWLQFEGWTPVTATPPVAADARNVAVGRTIDVSVPQAPAPAASAPAMATSAPATAASAPATESAAVAQRAVSAAAVLPAPQAAVPSSAPVVARAASAAAAPASAAAKPTPASPATKPAAPATAPAARASSSAPAKIIILSKPVAAESAAIRASGATSAPATPAALAQMYVVNVGLFAQENNARNALTQLTDAELPASTQSVRTNQGTRIRVRVGPFDTLAEADRAADKIRTMGLDAQVAPQ
ncbi:SPOR domain-containing protein [Rhodoferax sp.]|uniref:SPOR domain-containing protein n=1 Tax=Rhodoferax sp. TaxID=50421 RepID=UPI002ACDE46D|nr:SPOR domain-containing protein [Rhodoferax sp.]MDZ7919666.1 SPOR domain-containing protein [Rhodoferax sp.]